MPSNVPSFQSEAKRASQSISVALITFNRAPFLRKNLPILCSQLSESDELLLIDNNSTDETAVFLKSYSYPAARKIFEPRHGLNICRNVALREARHDWVAFIDDDGRPRQDWLEAFREGVARIGANVAVCAGRRLIEY